jgi:type IV pilus assembly protein PilB
MGENVVPGANPSVAEAENTGIPADPGLDALLDFGISPEHLQKAIRIRERMADPRSVGSILVDIEILEQDDYDRLERGRRAKMSVAEILMEDGFLTDTTLAAYQGVKSRLPSPPDREVLLGGGLVREDQYLAAVGELLDVPFVVPHVSTIDVTLYSQLPFAYLLKNLVLPLRKEAGALVVCVATPEDEGLIAELESTFDSKITRFCSTAARIAEALRTLERVSGKSAGKDIFTVQYRELDRVSEHSDETGEEAIQLIDYLLSRAVQLGASDLHIEPGLHQIRVRVRIDGALHHLTEIPSDFTPRLIARTKILARMDVTEKRLHQDGKIHVKVDGKEIDIRVSSYASMFGETIVMRLLDRDQGIVPLDRVGFQPRAFESLDGTVLRASSGLVLIVGPTGSGKTTTLYSFVQHANDPSQKVITCEEPVEYVIEGIVQCSVNSKMGPTFADSLRAIVRQDPDTIVVGEIRDQVTANLALEAAMTGHKVYSTFHLEESVGAFIRLLEMGLEPFIVASTLTAVIAQRLVRRLCDCKVPRRATHAELRFLNAERSALSGTEFLGPGECQECGGTGYKGRIALNEVLLPDDVMREAVLRKASVTELRHLARDLPEYLTMQEDGILKADAGITSLAEIIDHAPRDTAARPLGVLRRIARTRRAA